MKTKNKSNKLIWVGIVLVILLTLASATFIYYKMPKEVCHTEETTRRVDLPIWSDLSYFTEDNCDYFVGEILCEEGVSVYEYSKKVCNFGSEDMVCLEKIKTEVCEIQW